MEDKSNFDLVIKSPDLHDTFRYTQSALFKENLLRDALFH